VAKAAGTAGDEGDAVGEGEVGHGGSGSSLMGVSI
jgi:hypothetical protein